jgi:serine/threonine protein kinase
MEQMWRESTKSYLVMELCEGNLREEMESCDYELSKAKKYFGQIVEGMSDLFNKNVIHRDLKFENILVKNGRIKISDFGLAKFMGSEL